MTSKKKWVPPPPNVPGSVFCTEISGPLADKNTTPTIIYAIDVDNKGVMWVTLKSPYRKITVHCVGPFKTHKQLTDAIAQTKRMCSAGLYLPSIKYNIPSLIPFFVYQIDQNTRVIGRFTVSSIPT